MVNKTKLIRFLRIIVLLCKSFFYVSKSIVVQGLLIYEISKTNSDTPHSVGLLRRGDRYVAETSTWQGATLTRDKYSCSWLDSHPHPRKRAVAASRLRSRNQSDGYWVSIALCITESQTPTDIYNGKRLFQNGTKAPCTLGWPVYWGYLIVLWLFRLVFILCCCCSNWFCNMWVWVCVGVCVCMGFIRCGCVCVWVL